MSQCYVIFPDNIATEVDHLVFASAQILKMTPEQWKPHADTFTKQLCLTLETFKGIADNVLLNEYEIPI